MLLKKAEIAVPEDKKGKQIAVKESNINSLKAFFVNNYLEPTVAPLSNATQEESVQLDSMPQVENTEPFNMDAPLFGMEPNIPNENVIQETPVIEENPVFPSPIIEPVTVSSDPSEIPSPVFPNEEESSSDAEKISLVPEEQQTIDDTEMDPELQEIKNRLDQVILDLNNYKKKIKMLEDEVNQNLEKSREVLKDTQAAAKIMSIHQERQNQILNDLNVPKDDIRTLQKDIA